MPYFNIVAQTSENTVALYAMESAKASGLRVCAIEDDAQLADRKSVV